MITKFSKMAPHDRTIIWPHVYLGLKSTLYRDQFVTSWDPLPMLLADRSQDLVAYFDTLIHRT